MYSGMGMRRSISLIAASTVAIYGFRDYDPWHDLPQKPDWDQDWNKLKQPIPDTAKRSKDRMGARAYDPDKVERRRAKDNVRRMQAKRARRG